MSALHTDLDRSTGFALGYAGGKGRFRVYIMAGLAALFLAVFIARGGLAALALSALAASSAYYFYPLIETSKPRLGANQYGVFVDGFGVIAWRAIAEIALQTHAVRSIEIHELHIKLSQPLARALTIDWRKLPLHRILMRLPWTMTPDGVVRINLEPFAGSPEQTLAALERTRSHFG